MTKYQSVYGGALYDLAFESHKEEKIYDDLKLIAKMLKEEAGYNKLLSTPAIDKAEKKELLNSAWKDSVDEYTYNFLCVLCDNGTLSELSGCIEEYERRYKTSKNIIDVNVTSAVPLTDIQKEKLSSVIEKKTGKKASLVIHVDPSIMAGLKVSAGGKEYDGSVASHLKELERMLANL